MSCNAANGPRGSSFTRGIPTPFRDRGTNRELDVAPRRGARGVYIKPLAEKQSKRDVSMRPSAARPEARTRDARPRLRLLRFRDAVPDDSDAMNAIRAETIVTSDASLAAVVCSEGRLRRRTTIRHASPRGCITGCALRDNVAKSTARSR
jgi:hypothetical protein